MSLNCLLHPPERVKIAIMSFFAIAIGFIMRACFSVAITEMVMPIANSSSAAVCPMKDNTKLNATRFTWSQKEQGFLLSSFFFGYVITHIPAGILADRFGGKWTLSLGILLTTVCTLLTPVTARYGGYALLLTLRIFVGLGLGTSFPATTVLMSAWVPPKERSEIGSFVFGGSQIGIAVSYLLTGLILDHLIWDYVFYIWGGISLIWFVVFTILCYNDPASSPYITKKESDYLESQIGRLKRSSDLPPTPWKDIFSSIPMLSLICVWIGHDWSAAIIITNLPKYMSDVLGYSVFEVGLFSALPYIVMWIVSLANGFFTDYLIAHEITSITFTRKLFICEESHCFDSYKNNSILGTFITAISVMIASYSGCNRNLSVVFFVVALAFMGVYFPQIKINPLDLSRNFAGSLMAFSNGIGALAGFISPIFAGFMTPKTTIEEWRVVFWVTFGLYIVTTTIYLIGGSGDTQLWNFPKEWSGNECAEIEEIKEDEEKKST